MLDAHLSSNEESIFGHFLEGLAREICFQAFGGRKSTTEGLDLDFERDGYRYVVSVKSGPNWGNSGQIKKMVQLFDQARRIAGPKNPLIAVNGCCYGRDGSPHKERGNYQKLCGQDFWSLISGDDDIYQELVEPLGFEAKIHVDAFCEEYGSVINKFTKAFIEEFCDVEGRINWNVLLELNSGRRIPRSRRPTRARK